MSATPILAVFRSEDRVQSARNQCNGRPGEQQGSWITAGEMVECFASFESRNKLAARLSHGFDTNLERTRCQRRY
jgi:hypothetical protein